MKPTTLKNGRFYLMLAALTLTVGLISWDHQHAPGYFGKNNTDTVPQKKITDAYREKQVRDLDDVLNKLNDADLKVNMEKVKEQLNEAMQKLELKELDFSKMKEQMEKAFSKMDLEKMQAELKEGLVKIDMEKMKEEMEKAFSKVDMEKMKLDMEKVKAELKEIQPRLEQELSKAKVEIEKAKEEIKEYKTFVDELASDGLIDKKEYTLKHSDGELFINGKKASEQVYNKYRSFLEKHKKFKIEKSDDNFNIDND